MAHCEVPGTNVHMMPRAPQAASEETVSQRWWQTLEIQSHDLALSAVVQADCVAKFSQLGMQAEVPASQAQRDSAAQVACETMFQQGPSHFPVLASHAQPSVETATQLVESVPVQVLGPHVASL